jgi:KaiC/GvpD/RAD55 family RecA-like ATPase
MNIYKRYSEQVIGDIYKRGNIVEIPDSNINIDAFGHSVENAFHSVYMYDHNMITHVEENSSVRGFDGPVMADAFVWDFDHNEDIGKSQADAIELIERLESMGIDNNSIRVFFSGNKGFHVYFLSKELKDLGCSHIIPQISKMVCKNIAEGLQTADESIYDRTRIIRVINSKHPKSGLYKIPLDIEELRNCGTEDIQEMAQEQREPDFFESWDTADYIQGLIDSYVSNDKGNKKDRKTAKTTMVDGILEGFKDGNRNVGLSSLAGVLHSRNISDDIVFGLLSAVNEKSDDPLSEDSLMTIVNSVGRYPVEAIYEDPDEDDIITMEQAAERWLHLKQNRVYMETGYSHLDEQLVNFDPGKVMMVAARGGVGKTGWSMQLCNDMAKSQGGYNLFCSLEMPASAIFYRAAQIEMNKDDKFMEASAFNDFLLDDDDIKKKTFEQWKNTIMIDKPSLSIQQIEKYFVQAQEKYNGECKTLLIDYVGLIANTEDYRNLSIVAKELKNIAKRLNIRIVLLVQFSRKAGDGTIEPSMDMMRDSGSLEEAADIVIGMWRSPDDPMVLHVKFLKNRDGLLGYKFDLVQEGLKYTSRDFTEDKNTIQFTGDKTW